MYEDDALPFDSRFCSGPFQRNLLSTTPADALVLLLGGHDFVLDKKANSISSPFIRMAQSYGTYGYAVKRSNMLALASPFEEQAGGGCIEENRKCSPDVSWYHLSRVMEKYIYAINPLLVDHEKGTYSNTWGKLRSSTRTGESWMGQRNVFDMINPHLNLSIK